MRYLSLFQVAPLALAVSFASAYAAENAQSEQSPNNTANAVANKAAKKTDATEESVEEVVITGIWASLAKAQDIKMESSSMVDAIVAEDIGKLPDLTAAESIARIPGVQVTRYNDEASAFLIRGLPDVTTTYNGREFFTAEMRRAQLQDFPSAALAGIDIYKSATADLIEPGLAGLVNVRTRRPFDFDGQKISATVRGSYNDQSEKSSPTGNLLYSNRWDTSAGEMGFLGNVSYAESKFYNGVRYNSTWFPEADPGWNIEEPYSSGNFVLPANVGVYNTSGERWRPSANFAFQWRPTDELEIYSDIVYQGYRGKAMADNFVFPMNEWDWLDGTGGVSLSNIEMVDGAQSTDGNSQVKSLTKSGGLPPNGYRSTNKDSTNTYQYAIGAKWDSDKVHIVTDFAYTDTEYVNHEYSFDMGLASSPTVNANFYGSDGAIFDVPNFDITDTSQYEARGYYEAKHIVGGSGTQWRTDLTYDADWGWLKSVQTGVRYSDRKASRDSGNRYAWFWDLHTPMSSIEFLDMEMTKNPFRNNARGFTQYLAPTLDSIQKNRSKLVEFAHTQALASRDAWRAPAWETEDIASDPANQWLAKETNYAVYLQGNFHWDVASVPVDVYTGVRVNQTDSSNEGTSSVNVQGVVTHSERKQSHNYVDVLPNISLKAALTDELQFRLGFTQTRTKPNFGDLNPALNITQIQSSGVVDPNAPPSDWDAEGSGGNPDLKPLTSDNYDISLGYYFSRTGFVSLAGFYRDLWGFTNWYTRLIETPDYGTVRLNHPENAGEGKLRGWELSGTTFLDFEGMPSFLKSFGVSANVTHLEGQNRLPNADGTFGDFKDIPGLSRYTYNAAVFYENGSFSTRLSYNLRESWVNWYGDSLSGSGFVGNKTEAVDRLDLSATYNVTDNVAIFADVSNILANPFKNYTVTDTGVKYYQDVREEGRYFGLGVRFDY